MGLRDGIGIVLKEVEDCSCIVGRVGIFLYDVNGVEIIYI